jgi:hypothetical protein
MLPAVFNTTLDCFPFSHPNAVSSVEGVIFMDGRKIQTVSNSPQT